jgi:hypothetical protein
MVMDGEGEVLLVVDAVDHERASAVGHLDDAVPQQVADSGGDVANEDAGGDFEEPSGEMAAESFGAGGEDDDNHQKSTSYS